LSEIARKIGIIKTKESSFEKRLNQEIDNIHQEAQKIEHDIVKRDLQGREGREGEFKVTVKNNKIYLAAKYNKKWYYVELSE